MCADRFSPRFSPYGGRSWATSPYSTADGSFRAKRTPGRLQRSDAVHPYDLPAVRGLIDRLSSEGERSTTGKRSIAVTRPSSPDCDTVDPQPTPSIGGQLSDAVDHSVSTLSQSNSTALCSDLLSAQSTLLRKLTEAVLRLHSKLDANAEKLDLIRECVDAYESDSTTEDDATPAVVPE